MIVKLGIAKGMLVRLLFNEDLLTARFVEIVMRRDYGAGILLPCDCDRVFAADEP